jgi:stage II sporulation protein D
VVFFVFFVAMSAFVTFVAAQADVTDAQLGAASGGRVVRIGPFGGGAASTIPLEVYVARVLAGEGEPRAADAAKQALAVAIRTYALANAGRHARDGFDLCDSTHCQVPRAANASTRGATLATAGQILTYLGEAAELFYSASCGGYSETAGQVWPGADYPYLQVVQDDVHEEDIPWTLAMTLAEVERALGRVGFEGRLRDVRIDQRSASGRTARLQLPGLVPDVIAGNEFRAAIGSTALRSTAFSVEHDGDRVLFTGRGYGHGVGMCVIGAGRRAARGESAAAILAQYYPGLELTRLSGSVPPAASFPAPATTTTVARGGRSGITARVPASSAVAAADLEQLTGRFHDELAKTLGVSVAPISVRLHESLESFRAATGRPWWVSSVAGGTSIDLVPAALIEQRDGLELTLRTAVAALLVGQALRDRPVWVRVGASRHFARGSGADVPAQMTGRCPADAELTLAISASAQREAEARAQACFARALAKTGNWRSVR